MTRAANREPSFVEKLAAFIAPQAVQLTGDHVARMREELYGLRKQVRFQAREIKRLRRVIKGKQ